MHNAGVEIREARPEDAEDIAVAHRDSIRSIGPGYYPPEIVEAWQENLTGDVYVNAMRSGEVFFIAVGDVGNRPGVLGFASDYRIEGTTHGTSVYVKGSATRRGIGSALLARAEAHAAAHGAARIEIAASLAGVAFYAANGYAELARGETHLMSGRPIACAFMRKDLASIAP